MTEVLIVGAGPAGLLLAGELRLAGVDTVLVERHARPPGFCRGFTLNARALDLLARRGLAGRLISEGWPVPHAATSGLPVTLGLAGAHTDHPYTLGIPQTRVEEILEAHAVDLGADIRRGHELRGLTQDTRSSVLSTAAGRSDGEAVVATIGSGDGEYQLRAAYLVGCDGSRSTVRRLAGIDFPGTAATRFSLLGDVELADPGALPFGVSTGPGGAVFVIPRPGYVRIVTADQDPPADPDTPVTLHLLQAAVDAALGRRVEIRAPRWLSRFGNAARQAAEYVKGRVVLAGDAAHIHPPAGAIGVNVALDDAFNLGWKLAATVRGTAPPRLLASYHAERHQAGAHVLAGTRAQELLGDGDDRIAPLRDLLTRVAGHPAGNLALAETLTGLDTRYDMRPAGDHPWLGRLAPNLTLGGTDLATLLSTGRGVLLDFSGGRAVRESAAGWADRIDTFSTTGSDSGPADASPAANHPGLGHAEPTARPGPGPGSGPDRAAPAANHPGPTTRPGPDHAAPAANGPGPGSGHAGPTARPGAGDAAPAAYLGRPELRAVLVRPDGHVAWASSAGQDPAGGLTEALEHWYGPARRTATAGAAM